MYRQKLRQVNNKKNFFKKNRGKRKEKLKRFLHGGLSGSSGAAPLISSKYRGNGGGGGGG
jgi:hypothetical protein